MESAIEVIAVRYPHADAAFVAGSLMRSQGSVTSDIDLVVLHSKLVPAYRESFVFKGIPVEAFVHDPETLAWFLEQDRKEGHPALIGMLVEAVLIGPRQETAHDFKQRAEKIVAEGPPPLSNESLQRLRYAITDKLDDLEADRPPAEFIAIGSALYPLLAELVLRGHGRWNGSGKWIARLLNELDAALAQRFERAFLDLYIRSDAGPVLRLAEELLEQHGGRLFSGYRSDAPADWRAPLTGGQA